MKYYVSGAVAKMHYMIEFMKHVFPILRRPTGVYPYPLPPATNGDAVIAIFAEFCCYYDYSSSSTVSPVLSLPTT